MPISQSVGKDGKNIKKEVKYVQALLNVWREQKRLPLLIVDGIVGPKTTAAIEAFQRAETGVPDGRVDPKGQTIRKLEKQIASLSRELKAYFTLAVALSQDPDPEKSRLSTTRFLAITNPIYHRKPKLSPKPSPKQGEDRSRSEPIRSV
jgi:peptidoglycan hydrolase-like protein with peptidoglycan-binding domain